MTVKKSDCGGLCLSHLAGLLIGAAAVCAAMTIICSKKQDTLADKARKAFRTIEDTLSV